MLVARCRLLAQIFWGSPRQIFYVKFDFGYCFGLDAFIEDGGVSITLDVIAEQDGKEGDVIAVRKLDGTKLRAKVIGLKRVEIQ